MKTPFFEELIKTLHSSPDSAQKPCLQSVVVPVADDEACSFAIHRGVNEHIMTATLIGNSEALSEMYADLLPGGQISIIAEEHADTACKTAVKLVREGKADCIMKGNVSTSTLLKAVLDTEKGLKKDSLLSHVTFFELPSENGLKILSDAAINIAPDVDTMIGIINNAIAAYQNFENRPAHVALLAANEKVSDKLPSSVTAKMVADKFKNCSHAFVEGPISFDIAVSKNSAQRKAYHGRIQGNADILIAPCLEAGNILYKSLQYFAHAGMAGVVVGANCPIVLTSRADDNDTKFHSLVLGLVLRSNRSVGIF